MISSTLRRTTSRSKTFFEGEQSTIFARALDMLAIFDDSKTYIVNDELENIVAQMRSITRQEKPYANIPKLPELRERFMSCYVKILQQESAPVLDSIDQAWKRVLEVLSTKEYNDQKRTAYYEKFQDIRGWSHALQQCLYAEKLCGQGRCTKASASQ